MAHLESVKARQLIVKGNSINSRPRRRLEAGAARLPWDVRLRRDELDITRHRCRRLRSILPELRASSGIRAGHTSTIRVREPPFIR